jgi:predicted TPR repeat methyltransferase
MSSDLPTNTATLLQRAVPLHQQGKLDQAEALYQQVLQAEPEQFDALHLLGVLTRQRGDAATAVQLISRAIALNATNAVAHCNLGAALQDIGQPESALASYDRAIALSPQYTMALNNRGNALKNLGRVDEALLSYAQALQLQPSYADAWCNQGILLQSLQQNEEALASFDNAITIRPQYVAAAYGRASTLYSLHRYLDSMHAYDRVLALNPDYVEAHAGLGSTLSRLHQPENALVCFKQAIRLRPSYAKAYQLQGNALRLLGRDDQAVVAYKNALQHGGDAVSLNFALAALGAGMVPPASPAQYVTELFDQYAGHFDQHLLEVLKYDTPRRLHDLFTQFLAAEPGDTLDLGCGTGLFGSYLRPHSRHLAGVDLSPNMLAQAKRLELYDELTCGELTQFLRDCTGRFDLIVAADVFVYIGDLSDVFSGVRQVLQPDGLFSFSVERSDAANYVLQRSTRYAHSLEYLQALAHQYGLALLHCEPCVTRQDNGADINAYAVVMRALP